MNTLVWIITGLKFIMLGGSCYFLSVKKYPLALWWFGAFLVTLHPIT